ncbi:MAG: AbrB/MazE/SpoVT family DNA-binding domain-containing protein [Thermoproteota archaeon]
MRFSEVVKVDSKGRVTIPLVIREALNIVEGMTLILVADSEKKEIVLTPLPVESEKLIEIKVELQDVPGALAKAVERLAALNVDQVTTQCTTVKRGEYAECIIIADLSKSDKSLNEVKEELLKIREVKLVQVRQLQR